MFGFSRARSVEEGAHWGNDDAVTRFHGGVASVLFPDLTNPGVLQDELEALNRQVFLD